MVSRLGGSDYALLVPKEFLKGIDEDILNNEVRLREYLLSALKIGLQSFEFAGFTGSADKIEKAIRESMGKYQDFEKQFTADLDQFVEGKLTGTDSLLARKLGDSFGENGDLKARLGEIFDDISNPDKVKSVPNRVSDVIQNKFDGVEKEIASALDLASDDSPLRMFLNAQRKQFDELNTDLRNEMAQVKSALNVDAILQAQEEEKAELEEKSTHKGIHFED
ncbi:uncharacterized protein METZ01_LOCUS451123, partial [marine metagenome]